MSHLCGDAKRAAYRLLCEQEKSIPIFSQAWWLDALVGPESWDVVLVESAGRIHASMPFVVQRKKFFVVLGQPPLTQTLGPWLRETGSKSAKRLSREKDLMRQLIDALPSYHRFTQNWHHTQKNWLPFYWAGFSQTTRYTYRLPDLSDEHSLWEGLGGNIKGDIKKSTTRFGLTVRTDLEISDFLELHIKTFARQNLDMPYSFDLLKRLDSACQQRSVRAVFIAEDQSGRRHAGVYIVWDSRNAYYLMGGGDPALRNSGATSLCMWEAIKFARTVSSSFDFEGSMVEPIERFFRAFGAEQTPYFSITHTPSRLLLGYHGLRKVLRPA